MLDTALQIYDRFISVGNKLVSVLTPQYKPAAKALFKITDLLLLANQNLLKWIHEFELFDFDTEKEKTFKELAAKFSEFRNGPEYDLIITHCTQIGAIYKENLEGIIRHFMTKDKNKFGDAGKIFLDLIHSDDAAVKFVEKIMKNLESSIEDIKKNYKNGQNIQKKFLDDMRNDIQELEKQIDELRKLRRSFLYLSGAIVSV